MHVGIRHNEAREPPAFPRPLYPSSSLYCAAAALSVPNLLLLRTTRRIRNHALIHHLARPVRHARADGQADLCSRFYSLNFIVFYYTIISLNTQLTHTYRHTLNANEIFNFRKYLR